MTWTRSDLTITPPPTDAFDLVSAQYFPLPHQPDHTALRGLLDAVAPGGTLLFASHDPADLCPRPERGFDPSDCYQPNDIARLLDHNWTVLINETRPRTAPAPVGTHHIHDTVLRAQRLR
ncbi:hypothetical protein [Streptomyces sp. NPDC002845]